MDSFFKAAVCDLDKLLDDFELNSDELECRPAFLKAPPYPFSSLGSSSKPPAFLPSLPDLSSIHYGSASSCLDGHRAQISGSQDCEVGGRPLTGVDLLSSVDRGTTKSSAPPCPDRALKPVCDLVNDTSSAMLVRTNSHDAFRELEAAEMQQQQQEDEEVLLVDFTSPVVTEHRGAGPCGGEEGQSCSDMLLKLSGGFSASLSLLDVILPAAADRGSELSEESPSTTDSAAGAQAQGSASSDQELQISVDSQESDHDDDTRETSSDKLDHDAKVASPPELRGVASDGGALGLSSPRLAAFRAPTGSRTSEDGCEEEAPEEEDVCESTEADSLMVSNALEERADADRIAEVRLSPEGQQVCTEPAAAAPPIDLSPDRSETSPLDPPEFGFEYLPESDQAELLVTDEELDAFLKAHAEAEQGAGVSYCSEPESHPGLGGRLEDRELRMCGQERQEDVEGRASPESDQVCVSADAGSDQAALPGSEISCTPRQERSSGGNRSLTSPDQQTSYGGARPKLTHHLTARPPPAGEDEEERVQALSPPAGSAENEDSYITSPVEEHPSPPYPSQEHQEYSVGYEELSEPPPYPGEPLADAMGSTNCRRETGEELGCRQPAWVPDADAPNCMNCNQKFTFTRRRHHCRACGRVYCTLCCSRKCKLKYLDKEARVCVICFHIINTGQALERMMSPTGPSPNPNIPSEYCSTIPPLQQARAAGTLNSPPPTVMVPVSVLKQPNHDGFPREQKRVWFADGILPNGEVADTTRLSVTQRRSSQEFMLDETAPVSEVSSPAEPEATGSGDLVRPPLSGPWDYALLSVIGSLVRRVPSLLPDNEDQLPPLLIITGEDDEEGGDVLVEDSPAPCQILHLLEEGGPRPLTFVLNPNLLVNVKLVPYGSRRCWCFGSNGLQALGQRELVFLLECLPEEKALPRDVFSLYVGVYQDAQKGKFVEELDNLTFTSSFLGSKDHAGMLFSAVSCQPLDGLMLPLQPFLFGLLIHKLEVPWAKVFPLRLLLRLGAQYNVYPTPLVSVRFRDSLYRETGHTIMNLLADLRNYQYSLPVVKGLRIHMEVGHIYIDIPKSSFNEIQTVLNASNEHVISIGATFSPEADSHLVCFQNEEGGYQTQAHTMTGKTRTVTGASFVVFNGSLKASSGFIAKSSIVEDGLMVQIPPETMESLRSALRDQTDFHIPCGKNDDGEVRENVTIRWVDRTAAVNTGKSSGVDGRALNGVHSVRLQQDAEFELDGRSIRCTEVFYHLKAPDCSLAAVLSSCSAFQKEIAMATCSTLTPHLAVLSSSGINSFSLRISTQADMVEYQAGSGGKLLPQRYMNEMDSALIPVIHGGGASVPQTAMDMEFIFFVMHVI